MEGGKDIWVNIEKTTGLYRKQLRKLMFDKKQFDSWLAYSYK